MAAHGSATEFIRLIAMRITKKHFAGIVLFVSFVILAIASQGLLLGNFPRKQYFTTTYFAYSVAALAFTHSVFFFANFKQREAGGKGLSKNVPRYLDYGVTALITFGLVQIYFSEDMFVKYIRQISGTKTEIVAKIRIKAESHLKEDCRLKTEFTIEYCRKLDEISNSKDLEEYISKTLSNDSEFLNHNIAHRTGFGPSQPVSSPIKRYVNQYMALSEYGVMPQDVDHKLAWSWLVLILLPLIISLRATKTSLEIFGDLS